MALPDPRIGFLFCTVPRSAPAASAHQAAGNWLVLLKLFRLSSQPPHKALRFFGRVNCLFCTLSHVPRPLALSRLAKLGRFASLSRPGPPAIGSFCNRLAPGTQAGEIGFIFAWPHVSPAMPTPNRRETGCFASVLCPMALRLPPEIGLSHRLSHDPCPGASPAWHRRQIGLFLAHLPSSSHALAPPPQLVLFVQPPLATDYRLLALFARPRQLLRYLVLWAPRSANWVRFAPDPPFGFFLQPHRLLTTDYCFLNRELACPAAYRLRPTA
jgi:hypothetical protein